MFGIDFTPEERKGILTLGLFMYAQDKINERKEDRRRGEDPAPFFGILD